jgi:hypothetical protein
MAPIVPEGRRRVEEKARTVPLRQGTGTYLAEQDRRRARPTTPGRQAYGRHSHEEGRSMRQVLVLAALVGALAVAIGGYTAAQDDAGTPDLESVLCASPEASPAASPEVSPDMDTSGSPEAVASEVAEEIEGAIEEIVCGSPEASD